MIRSATRPAWSCTSRGSEVQAAAKGVGQRLTQFVDPGNSLLGAVQPASTLSQSESVTSSIDLARKPGRVKGRVDCPGSSLVASVA
jgi:hypothetical protein